MLELTFDRDAAQTVVELLDDAVVELTPDGVVTACNTGATRLYGSTDAMALGDSFFRIVPDELLEVERRRMALAASGEVARASDSVRLGAGGALTVSSTMFPIRDDHGRVTAVGVIERDVTQQRALESKLLEATRLETVGRIAGGAAQEFNNINTVILSLATFLSQRIADLPDALADLRDIRAQAIRGAQLASHLLAFGSRRDRGLEPVRLNDCVRSVAPLAQRLVGERIWLTTELDSSDALTMADSSQLELIVFELVLRASNDLPGGGNIEIATRCVAVDDMAVPAPASVPTGEYVQLSIKTSRSRYAGATSVPPTADDVVPEFREFGMAMIVSLAARFGGRVVTQPAQEGSAAETAIYLPIARQDGAAPVATAVDYDAGAGETILLVEDDPAVRSVMARALRARGHEVLEAQHGEDALAVAGAHAAPINLVVTDVVMPHMDGPALFDELRRWYPGLRVLFVSGYTRGTLTQERCDDATDFLAKPFTMDLLCETAERLLARHTR